VSHAPTRRSQYDISNHAELTDAIASAESDREWIITVMDDIVANDSIVIASNMNVKVLGSSALGRRAQVTPSTAGMFFFDDGDSENITLWLENLHIAGFDTSATTSVSYDDDGGIAVRVPPRSSATFFNCHFAENFASLVISRNGYPVSSVTVRNCWVAKNSVAIQIDSASSLTVQNSRFAENGKGVYMDGPYATASVYDSEFLYNDAAKANSPNGAAIVVGYTSIDTGSDYGWGIRSRSSTQDLQATSRKWDPRYVVEWWFY
jgi:hypothetical protein